MAGRGGLTKVAVIGTVAANGGDAAILRAAIEGLPAGTHVTIFDSHPDLVAPLLPDLDVQPDLGTSRVLRRLARFVPGRWRWRWHPIADVVEGVLRRPPKALREADVVWATGGTWLVETYDLTHRWVAFRQVRRAGKPLVLLTMSLGPFTGRNRKRMQRVRAEAIFVRDRRSHDHLAELGIASEVVPDLAFALTPPPPRKVADVIVAVREWGMFATEGGTGVEAYREAIRRAVEHLVAEGRTVRFVSTCQGLPGYRDDSEEALRIAPDPAMVDRDWHGTDDLLAILGGAELVITTRMHVAILALVAGTPALPIAYEFKTTELYRSLGAEHVVTDVNDVDPDRFLELVRTFDGTDLVAAAKCLAGPARRATMKP